MNDETALQMTTRAGAWLRDALLSDIDHAIIFFTLDGVVAEWLGAAERLLGYTSAQAIGLAYNVFFTAEDQAQGMDEQELRLARTVGRSEDDRWHVKRDGGVFWASGVLSLVRDPAGNALALCKILRDRTDVRTQVVALEAQVAARTVELEERDRTSSVIVHELRNPMMPIVSALAVIQRSTDAPLRAQASEILVRQVANLKRLIDDLSERDVPRAVGQLLRLERLDLNEALRETTDGLRAIIASNGLTLQVVLPSEPIWIAADRVRVQQMVANLLGNAIKYTPADGSITLNAAVEGNMAVTRVQDTGRGISADVLPRVFELFTREEPGGPIPGMGVGLAVVRDLARRHGGSAEARSPGPGLGSTFGVRLPLYGSAGRLPLAGAATNVPI